MRRRVPKPKIQQQVRLPDRLLEFMRYTHNLIETGDECATLESDDLIQQDDAKGKLSACGGLIEEGGTVFGFTYYADGTQKRRLWELMLTRDQIADIASGRLPDLTLWACSSPDCGCKFYSEDGLCFDCDYETIPPAA